MEGQLQLSTKAAVMARKLNVGSAHARAVLSDFEPLAQAVDLNLYRHPV